MAKSVQRAFTIHSSHWLALCIFLGHLLATGALLLIPIPIFASYFLVTVLILSAIYYWLQYAQLALAGSWLGLRLEDDCIILIKRNGDEFIGKLLESSFISPHLVILQVALPGSRFKQNVVLLPDSMDPESFRKLRVAVRWGAPSTA